jgi:hypothetical protein
MNIYFTGEDSQVVNRSKYLRGGLLKNGHEVRKKVPADPAEEGIWFHGISRDDTKLLPEAFVSLMGNFRGRLVFFRNDDGIDFALDKIPGHLAARASLFLRNHWPSDTSSIPVAIRGRTGFVNPLLRPIRSRAGKRLDLRPIPILFYGAGTGGGNLGAGRNCRVEALRMIRNASLPIRGGLIEQDGYPVPEDLLVSAIPQREHNRLVLQSRICLALWGNCVLTYRFFEGLAHRSLVLVPSLSGISFVHCGLVPQKHFVEVKADLSDLVGKLGYYLSNLREAQQIADAGFEHFRKHFEFSGVDFPQPMLEEILSSWCGLLAVDGRASIRSRIAKMILPFAKSV